MPFKDPEDSLYSCSLFSKETPLIDRAQEIGLLKEAEERAIGGEGGLSFLFGELGIGETWLTQEQKAYARSRGMQVLWGKCPTLFRMGGVSPYVGWTEVKRSSAVLYIRSTSKRGWLLFRCAQHFELIFVHKF